MPIRERQTPSAQSVLLLVCAPQLWRIVKFAGLSLLGAGPPQHGLSSKKTALITSDCGAMRSPGRQTALITSGCARASAFGAASELMQERGGLAGASALQISRRYYIHPQVDLLTEHV